jgi:hypothetical protein
MVIQYKYKQWKSYLKFKIMIYRGEDKALAITITDSSGTLQDIDAMTDLVVTLYSAGYKKIMAEYRKVATTGFTTLLRVSATEYTAIVPKTVTDSCPLDNLLIEIEIQESDVRFLNSIRRTKGTGIITEVKNSVIDE